MSKNPENATSTNKIADLLQEDLAANKEIAGLLTHPAYIELEEKLNQTEAQLNDSKNQLLRNQAELENIRKRAEKDVSNAHKYGLEKLVNELLAVVDSLEHGLNIEVGDNEFAKRMHEGMEMTRNLFIKALEKQGVKQLNPVGEQFNPEIHQALSMQEDPALQPNTVIQVLQKGYTLNDRLLRPALVTVSKS